MKYRYFYQTSGNENREGWIDAANRDAAYGLLRKQGIRPYRLVGDNPSPWRKRTVYAVAALGIVVVGAAAGAFAVLSGNNDRAPMVRQQIYGDRSAVEAGIIGGWANVFERPLERYLAAYAIPGREARSPILTPEEILSFAEDLKKPVVHERDERSEFRQMRNIVAWMKAEMREYVAADGTIEDYLELLDERQQFERDFRIRAATSIEKTPKSHLYAAWMGVNARLRDMGIEPLEMPFDRLDDIW